MIFWRLVTKNKLEGNRMKIKLCPQLRLNMNFCIGLSIVYYLVLVYLFFDIGFAVVRDLPGLALLVLICGLVPVLYWIPYRKKLATIQIEENVIRSCLNRKVACEVCTDRDVYYTVFESDLFQGVRSRGTYILLSNEPFEKDRVTGKKGVRYDTSRQIVLPYNEKTMPLLSVEYWQSM